MEIRKLKYFITVADEQSFSKAAQILHISQPSLSNAIIKLENDLKMALFKRDTRSIYLTDIGKVFYQRALHIVRQFEHFQLEVAEMAETGDGHINIGIIESAKFWLFKVIKEFKNTYPDIHFQFNEVLGQKEVISSILEGDVHFTITNQPMHNQLITSHPLYHEPFMLAVYETHPLARKTSVELTDIANQAFIISREGFQTRGDVLQAFMKEQLYPKIEYEIERLETACKMVEEGLGVTILPKSYLDYNPTPHIIGLPITSIFLNRTVYLAYLKDRSMTPAIQKLLNKIRQFEVF
ncbi:LysR family transcriptional regulator [Cytobacillus kochii]|uniref:LysR family transcriptional regulator n=1 Tax=Cytobacillus kochii TaxID=859143 RepID=A0A248TKL9_9BACI|nr:LysR family transcriptional regulator [Cytobacillus kochii]ASV68701.1 LysR family transcriptional regulator [Cytobacillus kochii]MED1604779.1 LysR family transcriptional regulator [Cytobacillus kochii]